MAVERKPLAQHGEEAWYKDAVLYELRVRSFADSNDDGIGDFPGLTSRLDYLQDLGVTALWILPHYPSPLRDDGYDIADYMDVHPELGTLTDFKVFLREAHARGLRVVTELVINHTSDRHPWFQRARLAPPGSPARDFYVWSDTPDRFPEARIIFKDFETSNWAWDPVARAYYWHRFYSHQPDLNFDNPRVVRAVMQVVDFWLEMGVDGMRLDAIPYLFEREGTNCENLPESHAFLRQLRAHVDEHYANRMLLAEANQWPEEAAAYFGGGEGDECHMAFHFPVMPRLFMGIRQEDRFPIVDILAQTPSIPARAQWALFLRNHDELTLEMVTDEERDYMYRVYAADRVARLNLGIRRRLAPLLGNDRKRIELMNALLFSLPGTPVVYYGDEIGMGDNIYLGDRNGVRTPMQWSADRNAGFSRSNPQKLFLPTIIDPEYHYESVNVEAQQANQHSLLWWTKRMISLRKRFHAFGHGTLELLAPKNPKVLAFVRREGDETLLVVCNLSRFAQPFELDLSAFQGMTPVELFGRTDFPVIGPNPYFLTLGPHGFCWFALERRAAIPLTISEAELLPSLEIDGPWEGALVHGGSPGLRAGVLRHVQARSWARGRARPAREAVIVDLVPVPGSSAQVAIVKLEHPEGADRYILPLAFAAGREAERLLENHPGAAIARATLRTGGRAEAAGLLGVGEGEVVQGLLYDALYDPSFCRSLLDLLARGRRSRGRRGALHLHRLGALRDLWDGVEPLWPKVLSDDRSNSAVVFGDRFLLKLMRRFEDGVHPEHEILGFLGGRSFVATPSLAGVVEYQCDQAPGGIAAILERYVANEGDGWSFTRDWLGRFFDQALVQSNRTLPPMPTGGPLASAACDTPPAIHSLMGDYLEFARLLGTRTGELHVTLASEGANPDFKPEPFNTLYQRSLYQSLRNVTGRVLRLLKSRIDDVPVELRDDAGRLLDMEGRIHAELRRILGTKLSGHRIRVHGDYRLDQVLWTGLDLVIIDFEGDPAHPLGERRLKRSAFRDVVGMLRSLHYAAYSALPGYGSRTVERPADLPVLEPWARLWLGWSTAAFLRGYLGVMAPTSILPDTPEDRELLLSVLWLEKTVWELGHELMNRPALLKIPLQALLERFA